MTTFKPSTNTDTFLSPVTETSLFSSVFLQEHPLSWIKRHSPPTKLSLNQPQANRPQGELLPGKSCRSMFCISVFLLMKSTRCSTLRLQSTGFGVLERFHSTDRSLEAQCKKRLSGPASYYQGVP